jgi:hypothetical protein
VRANTPTLTTPVIGDFTNAVHTHSNAAGGGQITDSALSAAVGIAKGGTGQTTATAGFNALDPLTTKGDLVSHDGVNSIRVAVGANGTCPVADSAQTAGWSWTTCPGGGGGGSGTINSGVENVIPKYTAVATTIDDSLLSDNGTKLDYSGTGGVTADFYGPRSGTLPASGLLRAANNVDVFAARGTDATDYTWKLSTTQEWTTNAPINVTAGGASTFTEQTAPGSPADGGIFVWGDSTDEIIKAKDKDGVVSVMVVPDSGAANNFITAVSSAGIISKAQPAFSNLSGSATAGQLPTATTSASGISELATGAETTTGTDTGRTITPDALRTSDYGKREIQVELFGPTTDTATGDGKRYYVVPSWMNGFIVSAVRAQVITAGTTNATNVDIARCATAATGNACSGTVVDVLSTNITVDSGENSTDTAAAAAVIDTANDDLATGQILRFDVDAVSTTAAKGLIVTVTVSK